MTVKVNKQRAGVFKRGNRWAYRMRVPDLVTGKTKQVTIGGFHTEKEAKADLVKARAKVLNGSYISPSNLTVEQYLTEWIEIHATSLKPTTEAEYRARLRLYVIPHIGRLKLSQVRPTDLQRLYLLLRKEGGNGGNPLSAKSVENIGAVLKKAFQHALDVEQLITRNPASRLTMPKGESKHNTTWTPEELNKFLNGAESHRLFAFFRLSAYTGARRSEVLGLKWSDLDTENKRISIERVRVKTRDGVQEISSTKGGNGKRIVTLDGATISALKDHKKRQLEERLLIGEGWQESGYIFVREDGAPIDPDTPSQLFTRLRKALDLPEQRLHDLRHIHATELLQANVPLHVVADRLGHRDAMVTATIYAHVRPAQAVSVAEIFAKAIEN